jgi:2-polyprenyl-6-methoxyphenol hydroxylase-like FAD-dependent oxidoreductase
VAKRVGVPAERMLAWGIARSPFLQERTAGAVTLPVNGILADFSYRCEPFAGPGYFLAGDAATFVDPIFSTGVCLGMATGLAASRAVARLLRGEARPEEERRRYAELVQRTTAPFFRLVRLYYDQAFRELFFQGSGPFGVHRAVISILAAHVFPRPGFDLRWRMWLFERFVEIQRLVPLAPRRRIHSLLEAGEGAPAAVPALHGSEHAGT